ncbi:hypothetical protein BGZ63DRAFT_406114 [Mariannaea sp. PMI_226]|nr:hypothetical protein BGZ63DRAFT_406114 [Mariannaea sp. PMI_226]
MRKPFKWAGVVALAGVISALPSAGAEDSGIPGSAPRDRIEARNHPEQFITIKLPLSALKLGVTTQESEELEQGIGGTPTEGDEKHNVFNDIPGPHKTVVLNGAHPKGPRITIPPTLPGEPSTVVVGPKGFHQKIETVTVDGDYEEPICRTVLPLGPDGQPSTDYLPVVIVGKSKDASPIQQWASSNEQGADIIPPGPQWSESDTGGYGAGSGPPQRTGSWLDYAPRPHTYLSSWWREGKAWDADNQYRNQRSGPSWNPYNRGPVPVRDSRDYPWSRYGRDSYERPDMYDDVHVYRWPGYTPPSESWIRYKNPGSAWAHEQKSYPHEHGGSVHPSHQSGRPTHIDEVDAVDLLPPRVLKLSQPKRPHHGPPVTLPPLIPGERPFVININAGNGNGNGNGNGIGGNSSSNSDSKGATSLSEGGASTSNGGQSISNGGNSQGGDSSGGSSTSIGGGNAQGGDSAGASSFSHGGVSHGGLAFSKGGNSSGATANSDGGESVSNSNGGSSQGGNSQGGNAQGGTGQGGNSAGATANSDGGESTSNSNGGSSQGGAGGESSSTSNGGTSQGGNGQGGNSSGATASSDGGESTSNSNGGETTSNGGESTSNGGQTSSTGGETTSTGGQTTSNGGESTSNGGSTQSNSNGATSTSEGGDSRGGNGNGNSSNADKWGPDFHGHPHHHHHPHHHGPPRPGPPGPRPPGPRPPGPRPPGPRPPGPRPPGPRPPGPRPPGPRSPTS